MINYSGDINKIFNQDIDNNKLKKKDRKIDVKKERCKERKM